MTENDPTRPGGPMSERMQALLSRAAEEQLTEQRQVSAVLADLRGLVNGLAEQLQGTASSTRLESLGGDVASLFTELRTSTAGLAERFDALSRRVDEHGAATAESAGTSGAGHEALAVRVSALGDDLSSQSTALDRLTASVSALAAFPDALASIQREVSGLHDRLAPLGEVRSGLADLTARTGAIEALRPEVGAITSRLDTLATGADITRSRDSLVAAVTERMDRVEGLAARPSVGPDDLGSALAPLLERLETLTVSGPAPVVDRLSALDGRLAALEEKLGAVMDRLTQVSEAAGGVPAVAADLVSVVTRLDDLAAVRDDVAALRAGVTALQDDSPLPSLVLGVAALQDDVDDLGSRVSAVVMPSVESISTGVGQQLTDRLVDELAPRVADVVLSRVAATLVEQVSGSVTTSVQNGLAEKVRAAAADSERRISAHVDEAVLALAEALLRKRRGTRSGATATVALAELTEAPVAPAPAPSPVGAGTEGEDQAEPRPDPVGPEVVSHDQADKDDDADAGTPGSTGEDLGVDADQDQAASGHGGTEPTQVHEADEPDVSNVPDLPDEDNAEAAAAAELHALAADVEQEQGESSDVTADVELTAARTDPEQDAETDPDADADADADTDTGDVPSAGHPGIDSSRAPAPVRPDAPRDFQSFTMTRSSQVPVREEAAPLPAFVMPTPLAAPAPMEYDDDDEQDGPPRRPWWRPGG